jgi:hypothetical protein
MGAATFWLRGLSAGIVLASDYVVVELKYWMVDDAAVG